MHLHYAKPERMAGFSDAVVAVIITIMVLELRPPEHTSLAALLPLWPTAFAYAVSYLFISIIWMNHHHLLRFVHQANPKLLWLNLVHLFLVSLVPFTTAWMADSGLSATPVAVYAFVFVIVNFAYLVFELEVIRQADPEEFPLRAQRMARRRSRITVTIFALAAIVASFVPWLAFGLMWIAILLYFKPEAPGSCWG